MNSTPLISIHDANIINGEEVVIFDLDMDVYESDFVYIVGKVGTGKTSIIRTIIAENPLNSGTGEVCGFNLVGIKEKDIPMLRRKMGVVFQDFQLLMDRTVYDNLEFVLKATGWKNNAEIDKRLRNNSFMKGASVQLAGGPGSGTNARISEYNSRRIIIRQTMDPDETYYIRFKTVMDDPTRYLYIDYLEYCAKEVYDNPEKQEDIW